MLQRFLTDYKTAMKRFREAEIMALPERSTPFQIAKQLGFSRQAIRSWMVKDMFPARFDHYRGVVAVYVVDRLELLEWLRSRGRIVHG